MAKTLAQGRKPGSGRKPGRGKTLREGRKPGSGRKKRDTTSPTEGINYNNSNNSNSNNTQQVQPNSVTSTAPINIPIPISGPMATAIPMNMSSGMNNNHVSNGMANTSGNNNYGVVINGAENVAFTSRDMEAVDALRELTYSPQFSPPMNSLPTALPPIVPSRSFPAINRILTTSPRPAMNQPGTLQSPTQQGPPQLPQQSKSVTGMISPPVLPQQPLSMATFNGLLSSPLPPSSIPVRSGPIRPVPISNGNTTKSNNPNNKNYVDSMPTSLNFITNSHGINNIMNLTNNGTGINQTNTDMNLTGNVGPIGNVAMNMNMNVNHNNNLNNNNNINNNNNNIMYVPQHQLNPIEQSLQRPPGEMTPKQHSQQSHFQ
ncbi:hypothetical protein, no similarity [Maudiozyma saulgeensis]|uniref:Uncharacterized protein n=1 Tax=Maudiozyma saulgeensis TaxID=1789683 RepID=A0A1X7R4Y6_9SACH|nr:hypothetical protein, no similarity [Kazachstania saulgeensis]